MDDVPPGGPPESDPTQDISAAPRRVLAAVRLRSALNVLLGHEWIWAVVTVLLLVLLTWRPPCAASQLPTR